MRPWSTAIIAAVQSNKTDRSGRPISYSVEHLDLFSFGARQYDDNLLTHLTDKYRDKPFDVILSIGPGALDFAAKLRRAAWPAAPVVFTALSEENAPHPVPPKTTGIFVQKTFASMVKAAQTLLPDLKRLVLVGNPFEGAVYYPQFAAEIPEFSRQFEIIDLMGLPVSQICQRVAMLPPNSAVFYFGINSDSERKYTTAVEALPLIAQATSRPIIGDAETEIGMGAIGGFVMSPQEVGRDAGRLVMRLLNGEDASDIPVSSGNTLKPMFDWRQLQRWNIKEDALPPGSEIRFRQPTAWQEYRIQILVVCGALMLQAAMISWLLYEHRRRNLAELQARHSMTELTYMNCRAAAGELSASIAHEVNQPLTGIATRASAALRWLRAETPDLDKTRAALEQIVAASHRASDIVKSVRAMFRKDAGERGSIDVNNLLRAIVAMVRVDLQKNGVNLQLQLTDRLPAVTGDEVQLQQVVLNLVMNAIEAMQPVPRRVLTVKSGQVNANMVQVSIEDTGTGVDPSNLDRIFSPLFTTKERGMGMGLSICHSIIENHGGKIWASPGASQGSNFQFELPIGPEGKAAGTIAA